MSKPRIALLGLGIMGAGMARRLLGAGFPLTVWNRNPARAATLVAEGAKVAATPREAAAQADIIISMVADDAASRGVWLGADGILAGAARGAIAIESSTLTVAWIMELTQAATARGLEFLDAPVTGSRVHAGSGELNFLVGGAAATLEKARPALAVMSRSITHLGPAGSGAMIKLINNFVCGVQISALAEALALIEKSGLNRAQALAVLTEGAPGSPLVKTIAARMTGPDYTPNFLLRLMTKDLGYAIKEGDARALPLKTAAAALGLFQQAIAAGHGDQDMSAVIEPLRKK